MMMMMMMMMMINSNLSARYRGEFSYLEERTGNSVLSEGAIAGMVDG